MERLSRPGSRTVARERVSRWRPVVGLGVLLALAFWAARVNVPRLLGPIKGDEATYVAMALSLADDGDLEVPARGLSALRRALWHGA